MPTHNDYAQLINKYNWTGNGALDDDDTYTVESSAVSQDGNSNYAPK